MGRRPAGALIDYWTGHGALLFGHGFAAVVEAVARQVGRGTHLGAGHELEVRWAELVRELVPSAERVRFTASGTEATQLALRVARACTGRPRVVKFHGHFHGWHDEAMAHFYPPAESGFSPGAVEHCAAADASSPDEAEALLAGGDVAALLLEPGGGSSGALAWSREQLLRLREATRRHGTLLVFDEVISGFRHSPGGVQQVAGVLPDLTTLAKILCGRPARRGRRRPRGRDGRLRPRHADRRAAAPGCRTPARSTATRCPPPPASPCSSTSPTEPPQAQRDAAALLAGASTRPPRRTASTCGCSQRHVDLPHPDRRRPPGGAAGAVGGR